MESIELPALVKSENIDMGFNLLGGREQTMNQLELRSSSLRFNYPGESDIKSALEGKVEILWAFFYVSTLSRMIALGKTSSP